MGGWDVIVVGVGGMGSVACLELARRGARVLGIEQHAVGHALGSSHGETRLYRRAYFEAPDYVPLMDRALALWRELERESGEELAVETGLALFGPPRGGLIERAEAHGAAHGIRFERLALAEAERRFPDLSAMPDAEVMFEPEAGFLRVERCVEVAARLALERGALIESNLRVTAITSDGQGVRVETERGSFAAARVVLAAGPWSAPLLGGLGARLAVQRQVLLWLGCAPDAYRLESGMPAFGFDTPEGFFYGFPSLEPGALKVARHMLGERVTSPAELDRELRPEDARPVQEFAARHLPKAHSRVLRHHVCMYTMTADEHFIVDRHPEEPRLVVAAGFSGHGFKFASAIGRAVADLALDGMTREPIGFLSARRFAHFGAV